jgi:hypothetical protein
VFSLVDALLLIFFVLGAIYWTSAQKIKQIALATVRKYCADMDVQFLDENIALRAIWLKRDARGNVHIWRSYVFDFSSTGEDRYNGRVVLLGRQIESLRLEPHRLH